MPPANAETLLSIIRQRKKDGSTGINFIKDSKSTDYLSYYDLYQEAQCTLGHLQRQGLTSGDELILQVEDNKKFLIIFWACLLGKIIPVPLSCAYNIAHKLKVVRVWNNLSRPHIVCEDKIYEGLCEYCRVNNYEKILVPKISLEICFTPGPQGEIVTSSTNDIAYIQYSSGSTGDPKGVILTHANLVANVRDIVSRSDIGLEDAALSWMPLTHDMGLICFHLTGVFAAIDQYIMPTSLFIRRPTLWLEEASKYRITQLYSPNFGYQYLLMAIEDQMVANLDLSCIRLIYNGAEPISEDLCNDFLRVLAPCGLKDTVMYPGYGLAEASVAVTLPNAGDQLVSFSLKREFLKVGDRIVLEEEPGNGAKFMALGIPVASCAIRICGDMDRQLGDGLVGRIQITGKNVTSGYYRNEAATEALFTTDGWLRTGDIGFIVNEKLVVVGRERNIIIINGQNYYPQDIESAAFGIGDIELGKIAACGVTHNKSGSDQLVLFVLFKKSLEEFLPLVHLLREKIFTVFGLVPFKIVPVNKIPKTTSGKLQHFRIVEEYYNGTFTTQLEKLDQLTREQSQAKHHTESSLVEILRNTLSEIIGNTIVRDEDNLLELGLDSLKGVLVTSYIHKALGVKISLREIFAAPTINQLAILLKNKPVLTPTNIPTVEYRPFYELSSIQKRFWSIHQYQQNKGPLIISLAYEIRGVLDVQLLEKAFNTLIGRHESLRTVFVFDNQEPKQQVLKLDQIVFKIDYVDIRNHPLGFYEATRTACEKQVIGFDISTAPLFQCTLYHTESSIYLLVLHVHHIIADGMSLSVLLRELEYLYGQYKKGTKAVLPTQKIQYKDYVAWKKSLYSHEAQSYSRTYWEGYLKDNLPYIELPFSKPRPALPSFSGSSEQLHVSGALKHALQQLGHQKESTLFMALLTISYILLYKLTGQADITLGTDTAGRIHEDIRSSVGCFLETLALRVRVEGRKHFTELLTEVRDQLLSAFEHQPFPFDSFEARFQNGVPAHNPFFNVLVLFQTFDSELRLDGLAIEKRTLPTTTSLVDLQLEFIEDKVGLTLSLTYNTDLFEVKQIQQFLDCFKILTEQVAENPEICIHKLGIIRFEEEQCIQAWSKKIAIAYPANSTVKELFERQVEKTPGAVAVACGNRLLTYHQLNEKANQAAAYLYEKCPVEPEDLVGILLYRSEEIIIWLLAILKTGAAYMFIDPDYPKQHIQYQLQDSGVKLLITDQVNYHIADFYNGRLVVIEELLNRTGVTSTTSNPETRCAPHNLAYIVYTSGSTGNPKGVMIEHKSLFDYVHTFTQYFGVSGNDIVIHQASLSFDTAVEEIFPVICVGGKLVVNQERNSDIDALIDTIEQETVTILSTTPAVLYELNQRAERASSLRLVISGGDRLKPSTIDNLLRRTAVYNTYGPTESTVCATYHRLQSAKEAAVIGKPIPNRQIYITGGDLTLLPIGFTGEICIAGGGLARGYVGNSSLTQSKFVDNPFDKGTRLYKTGDLGRWLPNGNIEFIGRLDTQLKIRGYRIEVEEVESMLKKHPHIEDVLVLCRESGEEDNFLIAYYRSDRVLESQELRTFAKNLLPSYMIPAHFIWLRSFPLTPGGKVERNALPPPPQSDLRNAKEVLAANVLEERLINIWAKVLGKDSIGVKDSFFEVGGTSIKASRILGLVQKELNVRVELKSLFMHDTIREFAAFISSLDQINYAHIKPIATASFYKTSYAQKRFWLLDRLDRRSNSNNLNWSYLLEGSLDVESLEKAFATLIYRHETLRTSFVLVNGNLMQKVHDERAHDFTINRLNLSECTDWEEKAQLFVKTEASFRFNLETDHLLRVALLLIQPEKYVFVLTIHHIITDGWSMNIFQKELLVLYEAYREGNEDPLPPLTIQYKDYATWEQQEFEDSKDNKHKNFWRRVLQNFKGAIDLPTDFLRTNENLNKAGLVNVPCSEKLYADIQNYCNHQKVSLPVLLLTALKAYLHKATGRKDLTTGLIVWGRNHIELDNQIGVFVNSIPVAVAVDEHCTYFDLLNIVKSAALECLQFQMYPYNKIVEDIGLRTGKLFNLAVSTNIEENYQLQELKDIYVQEFMSRSAWRQYFDISFTIEKRSDGCELLLLYNVGLYQSSTIHIIAVNVLAALNALIYQPESPIGELALTYARETRFSDLENPSFIYDQELVFPRKVPVVESEQSPYTVFDTNLDLSLMAAASHIGVQYDTLFSGLFSLLLMYCNFRKNILVNLATSDRMVPLQSRVLVDDTVNTFLRRLEEERCHNLVDYSLSTAVEPNKSLNKESVFDYVFILDRQFVNEGLDQEDTGKMSNLVEKYKPRIGMSVRSTKAGWNLIYFYREESLTKENILTFHRLLEKLTIQYLSNPNALIPQDTASFSNNFLEELYSMLI